MKITSRPQPGLIAGTTIGSGQHTLKLDAFELELISALIYQCRLGQSSPYSQAAFRLRNMLSSEFGDDFCDDAANNVDLHVTIEDDRGGVVLSTRAGSFYPTLEV